MYFKKLLFLIFFTYISFTHLFAQDNFDLVINRSDCSQIVFSPIERKNDYLLAYNIAGCTDKESNIIILSKKGKILDSIPVKSFFGSDFLLQSMVQVNNEYYLFGFEDVPNDSVTKIIFCKVDTSFKLVAKNIFSIGTPYKNSDLDRISIKLNKDKSQFYFVYGKTFGNLSYAGSIDIDLKKVTIKNVSKTISDIFEITELKNKQGFLITGIDYQFKTDTLFGNIQKLNFTKDLHQTQSISRLDNKYYFAGEAYKDDNFLKSQHDIIIIKVNDSFQIEKKLRIGKGGDTTSKIGIKGLSIGSSNRIYVAGLTFTDYINGSYDSWLNISVLDSNLNLIGTKYLKGTDFNAPLGIIETGDKNILFCGFITPKNEKTKAFVTKININNFLTADTDLKFYEPLIKFFPNPVQDELVVEFQEYDNQHDIKLQIYNSLGKLVHSEEGNLPYQRIDVRDFSNGIYFYNLYVANQLIKTGKFIKN